MNDKERNEIEQIRAEYEEHDVNKINQLRKLNRKVHLPGKLFGYITGCLFTLIFGCGFTMVLGKIFSEYAWAFYVGIGVAIVSIAVLVINPFIVKKINLSQRKKYQSQILTLSDEILKEEASK